MKVHWTARSVKDYLFRIAADFIAQLENKMESLNISQDELAKKLGVTKGRVSQLINHPGNISLAKMIEYARALDMKVSIVAYEDDDPKNVRGPINSEIFRICWEQSGKPRDFWAFQDFNRQIEVAGNSTNALIYASATEPTYFPIPRGQMVDWNFAYLPRYYVAKKAPTPPEIREQAEFQYIQQEN